jgi:NADPH-dependent stearoyl-CoA 9-desaturase
VQAGMTTDRPARPAPATILAPRFEWGIALQPIEFGENLKGGSEGETTLLQVREFSAKAGRQVVKDYVTLPALTSLSPAGTYKSTLMATVVANVLGNIWANAVIFCGHFPDGAEKFTKTEG